MDWVGCDVDADADAPEVMLTQVEPEGARSLPALALLSFFTFALRMEMGVVAYNSNSKLSVIGTRKQSTPKRYKTYAGKIDRPRSKFQGPLSHFQRLRKYPQVPTREDRPTQTQYSNLLPSPDLCRT